ncbi:MAG: hypothetical protein IJR61_07690 [Clostridia bacterium]|nr:hypothetical protein [Clostridia bacterium]
MHTHFIVISGGAVRCFNTVRSQFANSFGAETLFSQIEVVYRKDGYNRVSAGAAEYLGGEYLGDGKACLSFSRTFDAGDGATLSSLSFKTSGGNSVNTASVYKGIEISGETQILARAYMKINGGKIIFGKDPLPLFEALAGLTSPEFSAVLTDEPFPSSKEGGFAVTPETNGGISFAIEGDGSQKEYAAFFAQDRHIFSVKAELVSASEEEIVPSERMIISECADAEITNTAGSALTDASAFTRIVGGSFAPPVKFLSPFVYGAAVFNATGSAAAVVHENGVILFKKDKGYLPVNALSQDFYGKKVKCAAFSENYLFALKSGKLDRFSVARGELGNSYTVADEFEKVFAVNDTTVILVRNTGFSVYTLQANTITLAQTVSLSGAEYSFDASTRTLTAVTAGGIDQYRFTGSSFVQNNSIVATGISGATGVGGRWGKAFVLFGTSVFVYDTIEKVGKYVSFSGKATSDGSGVYFVVPSGREKTVYRLDGEPVRIGSVKADGDVIPCLSGVLAGLDFYPFAKKVSRFEIFEDPIAEKYSVYSEAPYFAEDPLTLSFEAIV